MKSRFAFFDPFGRPMTLMEWVFAFESGERIVGRDILPGGTLVSTVWDGLDESLFEGEPLSIFETMVFNAKGETVMRERYSTFQEAREGHKRILEAFSC